MKTHVVWLAAALSCAGTILIAADKPQADALEVVILAEAPESSSAPVFLEERQTPGGVVRLQVVGDPAAGHVAFASGAPVEIGKHWIGLSCEPVSAALRAQLGIEDGLGLVVYDVVADSPAQTAGFQKHDILLKSHVGDATTKLTNPLDLVRAVQQAQTKPLQVDLLRGGKPQTIEVTPAERPQQPQFNVFAPAPGAPGDPHRVRQLLQELHQQLGGAQPPMAYRMTGPVVVDRTHVVVAQRAPLPENVSISVTQSGAEAAKIAVTRGEESWNVSPSELDKLPADLQAPVRGFLESLAASGHARKTMTARVMTPGGSAPGVGTPFPGPPHLAPIPAVPGHPVPPPAGLEQTLQHLHQALAQQQQQIQALRQQLDETQKQRQAELQKQLQELKQALEKATQKN